MYLSEQLKLLFVHIPHTGGVSFKASFSDYGITDPASYFSDPNLVNYAKQRLVFPSHLTYAAIEQVVNIKPTDYTRCTIVRNPWTRIASLWLAVKRNNQHILTVFANSNSFRRFLEKLVQEELGSDMKNQLFFMANKDGQIDFNAVLRYENYDTELKELAQQLGADISIQQAEGRRKNPEKTDYFAMYGDHERKLVERYCEAEIELFQYRFGE